ncbi:MAG: hypothetical protein [Siphoviridae sp. ctvD11]|nr:MAG: hypothetical protein [Siphoviridae sp. ctvD11]
MNPSYSLLLMLALRLTISDECEKPDTPVMLYSVSEALDPMTFDRLTILKTDGLELAIQEVDGNLKIRYAYKQITRSGWVALSTHSYERGWNNLIKTWLSDPAFDLTTFTLTEAVICQGIPLYTRPH